jgi:hypothetical protein
VRYSTVLHSDVKDFGVEEAFALSNMLSLYKNCSDDGGNFVYCWSLAQQHGVASSESAFRRLMKKLVGLGLLLVNTIRKGGSTINHYKLTDTYLSRQDVTTLQKDRTNKTASVGKSESSKRSVVKQQIHENLSEFQRDKGATLADSPVVEYTVEEAPEPVQAFLKGTILPRGIYPCADAGEGIYIMSNGKDKPVRVSKRFKLEIAQKCVSLGLDIEKDMVVSKT